MPKILLLANQDGTIYNFRGELVMSLIENGYDVYISSPYGHKLDCFINRGAKHIDLKINRRGLNPFEELKVIINYFKTIRTVNPDVVLTYTTKCSVYGGFVCSILNKPYIVNNCGLFDVKRIGKWMDIFLRLSYKIGYCKSACLMYQNAAERDYLNAILNNKTPYILLPGSGVNIDKFQMSDYPNDEIIRFILICRIQKEKGIEEYLQAAHIIKERYTKTEFHILGGFDEDYQTEVESAQKNGDVIYHKAIPDVRPLLEQMHCIVNPSYHEGMSNVILEGNACGRPAIASDCSGCNDIIKDGYNGFLSKVADANDLAKQIERFITLPFEQKKKMGINARENVEKHFDRRIVTNAYITKINQIINI